MNQKRESMDFKLKRFIEVELPLPEVNIASAYNKILSLLLHKEIDP